MPEILTRVDEGDSIEKFKADQSAPGCYCVCHSPVSSRAWCEHCKGDNDVGRRYRERTRLEREVIARAKEFTDDTESRENWDVLVAYRELCRAVDALIKFESSQHSPPSG